MKLITLLLSLTTSFASFNNKKLLTETEANMMPCNALFTNNQSNNSDDFLSIKFTNIITGEIRNYNGLSHGMHPLDINFCDRYNIEIKVSVGAISSSVGIRANFVNGGSAVVECESNICCQDGYTVLFDDIRFLDYGAINFHIFLKNGGCL